MKRALVRDETIGADVKTIAESAVASLRADILNGVLPPGEPLRFAALRDRYGLSMGTLREALMRLAGERLVVAEGQRGFRTAPLSSAELRDLMRLRAELDSLALREAMAKGDDEWEAGIVAAFHRLSKAPIPVPAEAQADFEQWDRLHAAFHLALIAACQSPWLLHMRQLLEDQSTRYRRLRHRADTPMAIKRDVPGEHKDIMEAVLARDAEKAEALLRLHFGRTESLVAAAFGS